MKIEADVDDALQRDVIHVTPKSLGYHHYLKHHAHEVHELQSGKPLLRRESRVKGLNMISYLSQHNRMIIPSHIADDSDSGVHSSRNGKRRENGDGDDSAECVGTQVPISSRRRRHCLDIGHVVDMRIEVQRHGNIVIQNVLVDRRHSCGTMRSRVSFFERPQLDPEALSQFMQSMQSMAMRGCVGWNEARYEVTRPARVQSLDRD